jgi:WD40 repeat protein
MNREELQAAIRRPAEINKVSFDPGLVETLLDGVENKPGSLPLLQFALREMWGRQQNGRVTRRSYDEIGGVEGALAQRAEAIFAAMTEEGTHAPMARAFQRLFTRLVTLGEGQEDTRRVVDRRELGDNVWFLAQRLAGEDNRLVVINAPGFSRETVELVHEALIRHWPKLVEWINRDRVFQLWLQQIRSSVERWSSDTSDDGPLLRGGMLVQARDSLDRRREDLSVAELRYIEASIALRQYEENKREETRQAEIKHQQELAAAATKLAEARQLEVTRQQELAEAATKLAAARQLEVAHQQELAGAASKLAEARQLEVRRQKQLARIAALGGAVALILAIIAIIAGREFYAAQTRADANAATAQLERDRARSKVVAAQARRAEVELSAALALESIEITRQTHQPAEADAIEAAVAALDGLPLLVLGDADGGEVLSLAAWDGWLASGGADGKIKLWQTIGGTSGGTVRKVLEHGAPVKSLAVLGDGRLASGGDDGKIKLWPKGATSEPQVLEHGGGAVLSLAEWNGRLASGGEDGKIKLWPKGATGEPKVLEHGGGPVFSLAQWNGRLASGGKDGKIKLWPKGATGEPKVLEHGGWVLSLVEWNGRLASGGDDGKIKVWPEDGEPLILPHGGWTRSLAVMADGRLASSGSDGKIKLWPKEGTGEVVFLAHAGADRSLVVLKDGRLASGGSDGKIKLWLKNVTSEPVLLQHKGGIWSLAALADGGLASGGADGKIKLWQVTEGTSGAAVSIVPPLSTARLLYR